MDMQAAIRARLVAGVTAVSGRVYWVQAPQSAALPRITLNTVSDDRPQTYAGFQPLRSSRVQVDVWALTYAAAREIVESVITTLATPETSNGVTFGRPSVDAERDLFERTDTQEIHRISVDLIIWHS